MYEIKIRESKIGKKIIEQNINKTNKGNII